MPKFLIDKHFFEKPRKFGEFFLVQVGRRFCENGGGAEEHLHKNWYELTVVTDGEADIITNGQCYKVKKGDIHLSFPCDVHKIEASKSEGLQYDFFSFYTENEEINKTLIKFTLPCPTNARVFKNRKIPHLISDIINELNNMDEYSEDLIAAMIKQIVIYVERSRINDNSEKAAKTIDNKDILCYQIMNYIDTNIFNMKNLEDISSELKYNYAYLSTLFKKTTGNTILAYYQRKRLEAARLIIIEENARIKEVSEKLGYSSPYSFSRAFKEAYGISPKKHLKSNHN